MKRGVKRSSGRQVGQRVAARRNTSPRPDARPTNPDGNVHSAIAFLEAIYGAFTARDRVGPRSVEAAEERLGARLPAALRTLYLETGASRRVHQAHNRLVPLAKLEFHGDHLVFYEENQAVVVWGIARAALGRADPPVEHGQFHDQAGAWKFHPESRSVSEFACAQGAWQAVQGGLPFVGVVAEFRRRASRRGGPVLAKRLGQPSYLRRDMAAWIVAGGVVVEFLAGFVGLGTRGAQSFVDAATRLGIDLDAWDYATLRDE